MKKLILPLLLLGVTGTLSAQQNRFARQSSSKALLESPSLITPRVTCGLDISDYPNEKAIGDTIWNYPTPFTQGTATITGFGQYFEAPQPMVIGGALYLGAKTVAGSATIRMSIFNAGANFRPTGTALATKDTVISSAPATGLGYVQMMFNTPVTVTGNYVVTFENISTTQYRFTTNNEDRNSGRNEDFASVKVNGTWFSMLTDLQVNADVIIAPIYVTAATADFTLSATTACVGTPTTITNTSSALFNSRFYNLYKLNNFLRGTIDSTYRWTVPAGSSFGAAPTINPAAAGAVSVQLVATKKGWVSNCTETISKSVTYNNTDNATFSYASNTFCAGSTNPVPTTAAAGTFSSTAGLNFVSTTTGVINLATSTPGTYTVTYTTSGACPATSTQSITINARDNATFSYPSNTFCSGSANPVATTSAAGTFSATAGLNFVSTTTGEINLATTANGTYTITYTTSGACPATSTQSVTITDSPDASFTYAANAYCVDGTNPSPVFGTGAGAGAFSSTTGLSINANTGVINLAASTPGTYTVTNSIAASGSCAATSETFDVTIHALPVVTFAGSAVCANVATVTLTATPAGGIFSGIGVTGNSFATSNGTQLITYSYTDANGCSNTADATVTVNPMPTVDAITNQSLCPGQSSTAINFTSPVAGSTFAWTNNQPGIGLAAGGNGNIAAFTVSNSTGSAVVATVTVTATSNGCAGTPSTFTITVNNNPTVAFTTLPATICVYNNPITLTGATPAGGTYSGTGVTGTSFNPATAGLGTKTITYTYTDANTCSGTATANIEVSECLSVEDLVAAGNLAIYPNPASDVVTFGFSNSTVANVNVAIVSLDGKTVYQNQFQSNQGSIDVSTFARGTYMVRIQAEGKTSTAKLILN